MPDKYLISLGDFVFSVNGTAFNNLKTKVNSNLTKTERAGYYPYYQAAKKPTVSYTIGGFYLPVLAGVKPMMKGNGEEELTEIIKGQEPVIMILGDGTVVGKVIVTAAEYGKTFFLSDGTAQKVDFMLQIEEWHDD